MKKSYPQPCSAAIGAPCLPQMEMAIRSFLEGAGLRCEDNPELSQTPELVARAWAEDFLDGYQTDPQTVLASRIPLGDSSRDSGLVVFTRLVFQSVCPHHLLPYGGTAHVSYLPAGEVVGFGQIIELVNCLSHRLILQENLARGIADALVEHLGAKGAGVVLDAQPTCVTLRGTRSHGARTIIEAWAGSMDADEELRSRFLSAIQLSSRQ